HVDHRPVPAAFGGSSAGPALRASGHLRDVRARSPGDGVPPCGGRRHGALVVSRRPAGARSRRRGVTCARGGVGAAEQPRQACAFAAGQPLPRKPEDPMSLARRFLFPCLAAVAALAFTQAAHAEVSEVRISHGYGTLYLPLMVMAKEQMLEKRAKAAGLGDVKVTYRVLDGGNVINDAMLSGALDIASLGVPGFLTLWAKAKDNPALEIRGLSGMSSSSLYLMTRNPNVKSLKDFSDKDRIAVPGIKTSLPAVILHMAAAKEFGDANYSKLDPITVGLPHPEALTVLISGRGEINSHMASPPISYIENSAPGLHRVFNSVDVLGNITL